MEETEISDGKRSARIRPMMPEDIPAVAALEAECFSRAWSENLYRETLANPQYLGLVLANPDGTMAGYLCGEVILDEAEIDRVAVRSAGRRMGTGGALVEAFADRVKEKGVTRIFLEVRESNEPARCLYGEHGFLQIGRRTRYYENPTEDALILEKRIS